MTLDFSSYTAYPLKRKPRLDGVHLSMDGSIPLNDLETCVSKINGNWKLSEGGVLSAMAEPKLFFTCILNYNSSAKTTAIDTWDVLFQRLLGEGFPKGIVPCMFFASEFGCLVAECPFLHDKELFMAARDRILQRRRAFMGEEATDRQREIYRKWLWEERTKEALDGKLDTRALEEEIQKEVESIGKLCANDTCDFEWVSEKRPLKPCSRCQWTYYCSPICQSVDWNRHKKEPCGPLEVIIEYDDLWAPWTGVRKGTEAMALP